MNTRPRVDTVAMTAAFLTAGMMGCAFFKCAQTRYFESEKGGQIELFAALTSYALIIATIFDNEEREFNGVFHYEVTEPCGAWFSESLHSTGEPPDEVLGNKKIEELVENFFQGANPVSSEILMEQDHENLALLNQMARRMAMEEIYSSLPDNADDEIVHALSRGEQPAGCVLCEQHECQETEAILDEIKSIEGTILGALIKAYNLGKMRN